MVEVFALRLPDVSEFNERKDQILSLLSPDRRSHFSRFKSSQSAMRSVFGELLTRYILSRKTGFAFAGIDFKRTVNGKPYLENDSVYFNLSHSGEWIAFAFSERDVGIDVEHIREIRYRIAERFFSEDENKKLDMLSGIEKLNHFFDLWTLKESYLKMIGTGLTKSLSSFTIFEQGKKYFITDHESGKKEPVYFRQYPVADDYRLSVCSAGSEFADHLIGLNPEEMLQQIRYDNEKR